MYDHGMSNEGILLVGLCWLVGPAFLIARLGILRERDRNWASFARTLRCALILAAVLLVYAVVIVVTKSISGDGASRLTRSLEVLAACTTLLLLAWLCARDGGRGQWFWYSCVGLAELSICLGGFTLAVLLDEPAMRAPTLDQILGIYLLALLGCHGFSMCWFGWWSWAIRHVPPLERTEVTTLAFPQAIGWVMLIVVSNVENPIINRTTVAAVLATAIVYSVFTLPQRVRAIQHRRGEPSPSTWQRIWALWTPNVARSAAQCGIRARSCASSS